jgi:predicted dinucleotide-binding enzyme
MAESELDKEASMTTVAILGAGNVGLALGERMLERGVSIRFGVRDPKASANKVTGALADVPALVPREAVEGADMVLLAVPAAAAVAATRAAGELRGKVLIDCTNPLRWDDGPVWAPPKEGSVAAELQAAFPGIAVVKGFNHFGAEIHRRPELATGPAEAFFASDDGDAKARVIRLAAELGFRARDAGGLRNAALLENLAVLWIELANAGGVGRSFAFRIDLQA